MQTCQIVLCERRESLTNFARRRWFLTEAAATRESGIVRSARAVRLAAVCGLLVALTALPVRAQTWDEHLNGLADAPPYGAGPGSGIPGQYTVGLGSLTTINGRNSGPDDHDVDVYCINITDRSLFQAQVTPSQSGPLSLFLFDFNGFGVTQHSSLSCSAPYYPTVHIPQPPYNFVAGKYWLAVANGGNYPYCTAIQSPADLIWNPNNPGPRHEYAPNGPCQNTAVASWAVTLGPYCGMAIYTITLSGAEYCDPPPTCPTPTPPAQDICGPRQQMDCQFGGPNDLCEPTKFLITYLANAPPQYTALRCGCLGSEGCRLSIDSGEPSCSGPPEAHCTLLSSDMDGDGAPDEITCSSRVQLPVVSDWGLGALALLLLSGVALKFGRWRTARA